MAKISLEGVVKRLEDMGYTIQIETVNKNGFERTAIIDNLGDVCPVVCFEDIAKYCTDDESIAMGISSMFQRAEKDIKNKTYDVDGSLKNCSLQDIEARICAKGAVNEDVVTIPYLDMEIYFVLPLGEANGREGSIKFTKKLYKEFLSPKGTDVEIFCAAMDNTRKKYLTMSLFEMAMQINAQQYENGDISEEEYIQWNKYFSSYLFDATVITTKNRIWGAIAIADTGLLKTVADAYEDDLYIIPASINEILCIKAAKGDDALRLKKLVEAVNANSLDPLEKLTDSVYFYSRKSNRVEIA